MRFFVRTLFSLGLLMFLFTLPKTSFAAPKQVSLSDGYTNIMQQGLIFANICTSPAPKDGLGDSCQCRAQGICSLAEITQLAVNIIMLILGISGSIALLMFVYGGFNWVFAQGRSEFIQIGKDTMKHAIIGLAIIFGAYSMINFVIAILGGITPGATLEDTIQNLDVKENGADAPPINASDTITTN